MTHNALQGLKSDEFHCEFALSSNPVVIHKMLQRSKWVSHLKDALKSEQLIDDDLRSFTVTLLREMVPGVRFPHEMTIAAIAVALESRPTSFSEEFVLNLARLQLPELAVAIRVARKSCPERVKLSANKNRTFNLNRKNRLNRWQWAPPMQKTNISEENAMCHLKALEFKGRFALAPASEWQDA